ncbi:hypothetical protein H2248_012556 [Termitomyces sp. 'cryptogamus']|nr:hypothetical protein H2248_012556 [Termitomyces sp. 'cryptogamus']
MHPVLQISELLHHIFQNLNPDPERGSRHDLFSCSLTCKAFSEVALDVMCENLLSVTLLPFTSPPEDKDLGNVEAYFDYLERLKFYGKRVRAMRIHSKLTPELLKCIARLQDANTYGIKPDDSTPIMPVILPGLTTLSLVLPSTDMNNDLNEARIRTFLLPTVKNLSLHCFPGAGHEDLIIMLRSINSVNLRLSSLTLDKEVFKGSPQPPPAELELELTTLIQALPHLESLSLPLSVVTVPVLVSTAGLPELKKLKLSHPLQMQPLFAAPFASHLTSLLLEHEAPFNMNDEEYDEMARRLPNIEFLRFEVARHRLPRIILQSQQRGIRASLVALVSFSKHCPGLREIALTVDAEMRPVPVGEVAEMPRGTHAVKIDMLVSPVCEDFDVVATFFARHFPDRRSELTSSWLDFAESPKRPKPLYREYDNELRRDREDLCVTYASRWRSIAELAHKGKDTDT